MFLILPLQSIYYGLEGLELFMKLDPVWGSQVLFALLLLHERGSAGQHESAIPHDDIITNTGGGSRVHTATPSALQHL